MPVPESHFVLNTPLTPPFPEGMHTAIFGKGCFWSVEASFWELTGVYTTAVGYAGGNLIHPTYKEVCSKTTGHTEVVLVVFDPTAIAYETLLERFWKGHRPLQSKFLNETKADQYRSVIFVNGEAQKQAAEISVDKFKSGMKNNKLVTTTVEQAPTFYYAEDRHQQFKAKNSRR